VKLVALALFLFAWYVASPVFVGHWLKTAAPSAMPALGVVYWPLQTYFENPQLPGNRAYDEYIGWCASAIEDRAVSRPDSEINLSARTNSVFVDISLRVIADNLVSLRPIALTPDVDGDVRVTLSEFASLETRLSEIEEQTGYGWAWVNGRITIGPPATIQKMAADIEAETNSRRCRGRIAMVFSAAAPLLFVSGVVWQFRRGRVQLLAPRVQ
jgi:hypothetical protein